MAVVLWIMDEEVANLTRNGISVPASDGLSKPIEVSVLRVGTPYNPDDFIRIVQFTTSAEGGIEVEYLRGVECPEGDALAELCLDGRNDADQKAFVKMARDRFFNVLTHDSALLDSDILPFLTHLKWLSNDTLIPFWSCSGHVNSDRVDNGYICLSGELADLEVAVKRLEGQFETVYINYLHWPMSDTLIYMHPVLVLTWDVKSQACINTAIQKLTRALDSGLFNTQNVGVVSSINEEDYHD